jgi:predicted phosphodiesterase
LTGGGKENFMRLAVIADIHSNAPALEAVLADIDAQGVDEIIVAGDAINGGPFPREVLDILYGRKLRGVLGNHEQYVRDVSQARDTGLFSKTRWGTVHWTLEQLAASDVAYLDALPVDIQIGDLLIVHASPDDIYNGVKADTPESFIEQHFGGVRRPYVLTAHTHVPFIRRWNHLTLINPGSVGMPLDGNPAAGYAILTRDNGRFAVEQRRIPYDTRLVEQAAQARGYVEASGAVGYLMLQETLTGQPLVAQYVKRLKQAISEGLSEEEAVEKVPALL